jgi:hypothetical protein
VEIWQIWTQIDKYPIGYQLSRLYKKLLSFWFLCWRNLYVGFVAGYFTVKTGWDWFGTKCQCGRFS